MASSIPTTTTQFDEANPSFYVGGGGHGLEVVRRHFTKPYIYYLGSHEGCGCGFRQEGNDYVDEPDEAAARVQCHQELALFLTAILKAQSYVELYTCWDGEEHHPVETRRNIVVADLNSHDFIFDLNELILVYPE